MILEDVVKTLEVALKKFQTIPIDENVSLEDESFLDKTLGNAIEQIEVLPLSEEALVLRILLFINGVTPGTILESILDGYWSFFVNGLTNYRTSLPSEVLLANVQARNDYFSEIRNLIYI